MKDGKYGHRHGRNPRSFEVHTRRGPGHADDLRNGKPWRFMDYGLPNAIEPHYRVTARMAALPGKHMRRVETPVRAAHGKAL